MLNICECYSAISDDLRIFTGSNANQEDSVADSFFHNLFPQAEKSCPQQK